MDRGVDGIQREELQLAAHLALDDDRERYIGATFGGHCAGGGALIVEAQLHPGRLEVSQAVGQLFGDWRQQLG